jgi:hypothetical protein
MEIFKSVELILLLSFGLLCGAACLATAPNHAIGRPAASDTSLPIMQGVVVTAERLTAAEKRDDRRVATRGGSRPRS